MVFIWTGRGYWGVLLPVVFCFVLGVVMTGLIGQPFVDANSWMFGVAVLLSAVANWVLARRWNGTAWLRPWDLGGMLRRRRLAEHTIFSAPLELWSIVLVVVGVWVILTNLPGVARTL